MLDPFSAWSRMFTAGLDMQKTWMRAAETLHASNAVIGTRTDMMRAAAASPLHADVVEFARMVPEKVEAFSRSGSAVTRDLFEMQAAFFTQAQRMGLMMMAGRVPTPGELSRFIAHSNDYALGSMDAGARLAKAALEPVHRTATANARRLGKRGRSGKKR